MDRCHAPSPASARGVAGPVGYRSDLCVVLVVVAHGRLGSSFAASTSTTERGAAVLSRPAPLLESNHDHHPAAPAQRLGRMLAWSRHTTTVRNDASCSRRPPASGCCDAIPSCGPVVRGTLMAEPTASLTGGNDDGGLDLRGAGVVALGLLVVALGLALERRTPTGSGEAAAPAIGHRAPPDTPGRTGQRDEDRARHARQIKSARQARRDAPGPPSGRGDLARALRGRHVLSIGGCQDSASSWLAVPARRERSAAQGARRLRCSRPIRQAAAVSATMKAASTAQ